MSYDNIIAARILPTLVSVKTTATALPTTAIKGRKAILVQNQGSSDVYIGDASVTTSGARTGIIIAAGASQSFDLGEKVILYGRVIADTENVVVLEGV